jgi:hypothetical protein
MGGSYGGSAAAAPAAATYTPARARAEMHIKGARSTSHSDRVRELGG